MARRKMRKIEPAVQTILLPPKSVGGNSNSQSFVDLSQIASIVNRRFYRQGLKWAVGSIKVITAGTSAQGSIIALKLQETWITSGAWEKSMRHWLKQQNEALAEMGAEGTAARFRDFKIFMDDNHVTAYLANASDLNLTNDIPQGYEVGEWQPSRVVIPDTVTGTAVEPLLKMYGTTNPAQPSVGIVEGYALSRAYPTSPDPETPVVQASWLSQMFDVGGDRGDIVENATDTNDELPYDQDLYPGQGTNKGVPQVHDQNSLTATTVGGTTYLKGGMFPCGLMQFQVANSGDDAFTYQIQIELVPGPHRGYLCQPMAEM